MTLTYLHEIIYGPANLIPQSRGIDTLVSREKQRKYFMTWKMGVIEATLFL